MNCFQRILLVAAVVTLATPGDGDAEDKTFALKAMGSFFVGGQRTARNLDVVVRTDDGTGPFTEHHGLRGNRQVGLGRMIGKVEPDTDELSDPAHARPEPNACRHER